MSKKIKKSLTILPDLNQPRLQLDPELYLHSLPEQAPSQTIRNSFNSEPGEIKCVNIHYQDTSDGFEKIFIARNRLLGNPFYFDIRDDKDRHESILKFRQKLWYEYNKPMSPVRKELFRIARLVKQGVNVKLVCYCKPKECHGDVLCNCIQWMIKSGKV